MDTPPEQLTVADENEEGFRSVAYWDSIGKCWTAGYGQTGPDITQGTVMTKAQAIARLIRDEESLITQLQAALPWVPGFTEPRYGALVDAAYNLGVAGLMEFYSPTDNTFALTAMEHQDWKQAVAGFQQSLWFNQVPNRVNAICYMVYFNEWIEGYLTQAQTAQLNQIAV